jgi:hypothetical protein
MGSKKTTAHLEAAQILGQVRIVVLEDPLPQLLLRVPRQGDVVLLRELQQRAQPDATVQVDVQVGLGDRLDEVGCQQDAEGGLLR